MILTAGMDQNLGGVEAVRIRQLILRLSVANQRLADWAAHAERIEPELLDWIDRFETGTVFFDCGASIGMFSLYAAVCSKARVVAFEPEAQNYATLEYNHYLNHMQLSSPLIALPLALSDRRGFDWIQCGRYGAGEHVKILGKAVKRDSGDAFDALHSQAALTAPLDDVINDLGLPFPAYLKFDVDGSELPALRGAQATLRDPRVASVFIELSDMQGEMTAAADLLASCGYSLCEKVPVTRLRGGYYPDLYNCIFSRDPVSGRNE